MRNSEVESIDASSLKTNFAVVCMIIREMGKVIGGTKGNKVLEYISGAPVKEQVIERIPDVFDYDQLSKYGYSVRSD
jgi:hypothetical protein